MKILRTTGFTLIEVMIVVAIVALLVTIAYPSYEDSVKKTRRGDAQASLVGLASALQRFYTESSPPSYAGAAASGPPGPPLSAVYPSEAPLDGATKYYDLRINSADASSYELRAEPKGVQSDDKCGKLTLMATGQRGITNGATGITWQDCWR